MIDQTALKGFPHTVDEAQDFHFENGVSTFMNATQDGIPVMSFVKTLVSGLSDRQISRRRSEVDNYNSAFFGTCVYFDNGSIKARINVFNPTTGSLKKIINAIMDEFDQAQDMFNS